MHILFVHQNFPAQFRHIAPRLVQEHGWRCTFVTERAEGALPGIDKIVYKARWGATRSNHYLTRTFENCVGHSHAIYEAMKARPDIQPDLVVAHSGFGSSLFLPYLYDAPIINFLEYFYRPVGGEVGYRPDVPVTEMELLRLKARNAMLLLDLENCDQGWTPTYYQRAIFPPALHPKIEVIFDGIPTELYYRRANPNRQIGERQYVGPQFRVVTYVARGFEMMRGFDIFMKAAKRIYEQFPNVIFVVVGTDKVHYGGDMQYFREKSFRHHVMAQDKYDLSKFRFTGYVAESTLADILSISDLHIYLTAPFIASWSMVDAMACEAVVLASDQNCTREYITPGENGLLCDFFDVEGIARQAVEVLKDPAAYRPLGQAARRTVEEKYSLKVAMPRIKDLFERVAARRREPSVRAELLCRTGTMQRVTAPTPEEDVIRTLQRS
jgi:glycosyltransferase involved in cell wall biosynthesis